MWRRRPRRWAFPITRDAGDDGDSCLLLPLPPVNPEKYRLTRFNPGVDLGDDVRCRRSPGPPDRAVLAQLGWDSGDRRASRTTPPPSPSTRILKSLQGPIPSGPRPRALFAWLGRRHPRWRGVQRVLWHRRPRRWTFPITRDVGDSGDLPTPSPSLSSQIGVDFRGGHPRSSQIGVGLTH